MTRRGLRLYAGAMFPLNPFYLGLYGGSELPGFLATDAAAEVFFTKRGYQVCRTTRVLQRRLSVLPTLPNVGNQVHQQALIRYRIFFLCGNDPVDVLRTE